MRGFILCRWIFATKKELRYERFLWKEKKYRLQHGSQVDLQSTRCPSTDQFKGSKIFPKTLSYTSISVYHQSVYYVIVNEGLFLTSAANLHA
ncbi:hypothetical protein HI914_03886 [Erysiphe necator]|nr:hypothetical protein HI914_03886 [Erysiphe necator]